MRRLDFAAFKELWYNMPSDELFYKISGDDIEDETLRGMFTEAVAMEVDLNELCERIDRYLNDAGELGIYGPRDANTGESANLC